MSNVVETAPAVAIFPVRHHSPAASLHVQALIARRKPKIILIEGPSAATDLIPLLLADGTEPPVAVLCYFQASGARKTSCPEPPPTRLQAKRQPATMLLRTSTLSRRLKRSLPRSLPISSGATLTNFGIPTLR